MLLTNDIFCCIFDAAVEKKAAAGKGGSLLVSFLLIKACPHRERLVILGAISEESVPAALTSKYKEWR